MKEKRFFERLGLGVIVLALASVTAYAGPTIENGDFSAGLTGWDVDPPGCVVLDPGGYAVIVEDPTYFSFLLSQEFQVPDLVLSLSFERNMSTSPGGNTGSPMPDGFTACLLDAGTLFPLVSTALGYSDFYYLENSGLEDFVDTFVTVTGDTVSLNLSGLGLEGRQAVLDFYLLGTDDGYMTEVALDNVQVSVIPAPGALLLALIGTGAVGLWRRLRPR